MDEQVLIDTCIWATVFSKPNSKENGIVEQLIEQDRVVVIGPVLAEVLYGFRRVRLCQPQRQSSWKMLFNFPTEIVRTWRFR